MSLDKEIVQLIKTCNKMRIYAYREKILRIDLGAKHIRYLVENHPTFLSEMDISLAFTVAKMCYSTSQDQYVTFFETVHKKLALNKNEIIKYIHTVDLLTPRDFIHATRAFFMSLLNEKERIAVRVSLYQTTGKDSIIRSDASSKTVVPYLDAHSTTKAVSKQPSRIKYINWSVFKTQTTQRDLICECPLVLQTMTLEDVKQKFTLSGSQWVRLLRNYRLKKIDYLPPGMIDWINKDIMRGKLSKKAGYKRIPDLPTTISERSV